MSVSTYIKHLINLHFTVEVQFCRTDRVVGKLYENIFICATVKFLFEYSNVDTIAINNVKSTISKS